MQIESQASFEGVTALHRLPPPPEHFTGREAELRELKAAVQEKRLTCLSLSGADGVGKTALAVLLAHELAASYPDAQWYYEESVTGPPAATVALQHIFHTYDPNGALPEGQADLQAAFGRALHGRRALVICDNVKSGERLDLLSPPAGCLMLVTSRQRLPLPEQHALALDRLPQAQAQEFLLRLAPRIGKVSGEIAELCGGLPLALRLAGSVLAKRRDLEPAEYADRLLAEQWDQTQLDEAQAALALSYSLLPSAAQRYWRQLAAFPGEFGLAAAAAVWALDVDETRQVISELLDYAVVSRNRKSNRFRLPDLARVAAKSRLGTGEGKETRQRHSAHYVKVLEIADQMVVKGGDGRNLGLGLFDMEHSNIVAGQAWAAAYAPGDPAAAQLACAYPTAGAQVLSERQTARVRTDWLDTAARAAQRLGDQNAESLILSKLGSAYRRQGQPRRAIDYYERHLRAARELGDRRGEGVALGNLGLAYAELGNARRAIAYYQQHLRIAREMDDRRSEARTSWNLGLAYEELGDLALAIAAMQICVDFERAVGHPDAAADAAIIEQLRARRVGGTR